jgi:pyruvate kinase
VSPMTPMFMSQNCALATANSQETAKKVARKTGGAPRGSKIVVVCGDPSTPGGTTDLMRVQTI